jgi:APA family basic amino acid/polyamine antiporter
MMYGQTRVFFVMARDGLLPKGLSAVHTKFKTPWVITIVTGVVVAIAAAFLPVGSLADYSNAGTLFAFAMVSIGVMVLRFTDKDRPRPFKTPALFIIAPLSIAGCALLFFSLGAESKMVFFGWTALGLVLYFAYGYWKSNVRHGILEDHENDTDLPPPPGTA